MHVRKESVQIDSTRCRSGATSAVLKLCLALAGSLGLTPVFAESTPHQDEIVAAEANGRMMHLHARAIAAVREAMREDREMRRDRRIAGEITEGRDGRIVVTVLDDDSSAIYRATVSPDGTLQTPVVTVSSPGELSTFESGAALARATAIAFDAPRCGKHYDTIVFPSSESDEWVVYLLPQPVRGSVPIGGSYRLETKAGNVVAGRPYTRTCISLAPGGRSVGMMITHLLDPVPTDVHVFWSLREGKPFYVAATEGGLWKIENGRISAMEDED